MIAAKRREIFRERINKRISEELKIELTTVKSVFELSSSTNLVATFKPTRKSVVIDFKKKYF
jgi:hypothetical protein